MQDIDEDDPWLTQQDPNTQVSLLKPQIVKFIVNNKADQGFSKPLIPDEEEVKEDEEPCPFETNMGAQKPQTYDDLLYHPCEDEMNSLWA